MYYDENQISENLRDSPPCLFFNYRKIMFIHFFLGFILPVIINFLFIVFLVTCTEYKAYIIHIIIAITSIIPVMSWLTALFIIIYIVINIFVDGDNIELKSNKLTKFLFNKQN